MGIQTALSRARVGTYLSGIVATALAMGLGACAPKGFNSAQIRHSAPRGPQDVGVLVENAAAEKVMAFLEQHPEARVRVLGDGFYEIFGSHRDLVAKEISAHAQDNSYFRLRTEPHSASASPFALAWTMALRSARIPGPAGMRVGNLNPCRESPEFPTAKITVAEPQSDLNESTVELGQKIRLSTTDSVADPQFPSSLRKILVLAGPGATEESALMITEENYEFTPDRLGLYRAILVVQDSRNVCGLEGLQFIVTANRPYVGPNFKPIPTLDLDGLHHLALVSAPQSWDISEGEGKLLAVVDTGANYNHPSVAPSIELNQKEIAGNNKDDDENGLTDDVIGYDFVNNDAFPYDDDAHGTHVSGLAVGRPFGLARRARLLVVKALTSLGGDIGSISAAIRYAADRGAHIINLSVGSPAPFPHPSLIRAIKYAEQKGALIVAAAGNGDPQTGLGFNIDDIPVYPASLPNENIIAVGAYDTENELSPYSNFGPKGVDVLAPGGFLPGDPMLSAAFENPENQLLVGMMGTSMATPIVAGIAAQVWSYSPNLSAKEVRAILMSAGEALRDPTPVCVSGRHINALSALELTAKQSVLF